MSHRALSGQQFFHGTTARLAPGDELTPPSQRGGAKTFDQSQDAVYVTPDYEHAQWYAMRRGAINAKVYEVEPHAESLRHTGDPKGEHTTDRAVVKRVVYDAENGVRPHYSAKSGLHEWGDSCVKGAC